MNILLIGVMIGMGCGALIEWLMPWGRRPLDWIHHAFAACDRTTTRSLDVPETRLNVQGMLMSCLTFGFSGLVAGYCALVFGPAIRLLLLG